MIDVRKLQDVFKLGLLEPSFNIYVFFLEEVHNFGTLISSVIHAMYLCGRVCVGLKNSKMYSALYTIKK